MYSLIVHLDDRRIYVYSDFSYTKIKTELNISCLNVIPKKYDDNIRKIWIGIENNFNY